MCWLKYSQAQDGTTPLQKRMTKVRATIYCLRLLLSCVHRLLSCPRHLPNVCTAHLLCAPLGFRWQISSFLPKLPSIFVQIFVLWSIFSCFWTIFAFPPPRRNVGTPFDLGNARFCMENAEKHTNFVFLLKNNGRILAEKRKMRNFAAFPSPAWLTMSEGIGKSKFFINIANLTDSEPAPRDAVPVHFFLHFRQRSFCTTANAPFALPHFPTHLLRPCRFL